MTIEISLKKYKIYNLQEEYNILSNNIINLQNHILILHHKSLIDINTKNNYLGKLFELARQLNSTYNDFIIDECSSDSDIETDSQYINGSDSNNLSDNNNEKDKLWNFVIYL